MLLGAVADDLTGATDLSLMIARNGMRTIQYIGEPATDADFDDAEAVVVALKSRTIPATEAVALSTGSARALIAAGAEQLMFKYCSTFDSTDAGNIGPVAEALLDVVGAPIAIACPAFPAAGRSIYQGHLFVGGDKPTKESSLHLAMYGKRADAGAVVHLHSTHSVAVSILVGLDARDVLPPLTAYYVMRVGRLPLVPYFPPGDEALAKAVWGFAGAHHAMLLANHGPVVAGTTLANAQYAAEELEETAKLFLMLRGAAVRTLTPQQVADLRRCYDLK